MPAGVQLYAGDALWALMVYWVFAFVFRQKPAIYIALMAMGFSYGIEISQLYHAPWIDAIRAKPLAALLLGYGFLWSDIISYTIGIGFGFGVEKIVK
jgi:hypothetical protein